MRLTWRDAAATVLVAGIVALYLAFLADAGLPLVSGPRALAGAVLLLGVVACAGSARVVPDDARGPVARTEYLTASVLGTASLVAGLIALITGSTAALAVQVAAIVALWLVATVRHALTGRVSDRGLRRLMDEPHQRQRH